VLPDFQTSTAVPMTIVGLFLLFNIVFNFCIAATISPGRPPLGVEYPPAHIMEQLVNDPDLKHNDGKSHRFCNICKSVKPMRTHHCSVCKRCTYKMDHHCPCTFDFFFSSMNFPINSIDAHIDVVLDFYCRAQQLWYFFSRFVLHLWQKHLNSCFYYQLDIAIGATFCCSYFICCSERSFSWSPAHPRCGFSSRFVWSFFVFSKPCFRIEKHNSQQGLAPMSDGGLFLFVYMLVIGIFVAMVAFLGWSGYLAATNQTTIEFWGNSADRDKRWMVEVRPLSHIDYAILIFYHNYVPTGLGESAGLGRPSQSRTDLRHGTAVDLDLALHSQPAR
jgi:hypothetical protein